MLIVTHAVGRGVDDFVVVPLRLQFFHQLEHRFGFHHHARFTAERVVVGGFSLVVGVVVEVVNDDLHQPLLLRPLQDRFVEGRVQQFGYDGQYIDAHTFGN